MPEPSLPPSPRPPRVCVRPTLAELLADTDGREPWKTADSLSGSHFERVTIHGERFVVKYVCVDDDWILRATGDLHCRQLELFGSTNYSATLDPAKLMTVLQPELQSLGSELGTELQNILSAVSIRSASVDAALDSSGRIVTVSADIDMSIDGSSLGLPGTMSIAETADGHFYDYGATITIIPPST